MRRFILSEAVRTCDVLEEHEPGRLRKARRRPAELPDQKDMIDRSIAATMRGEPEPVYNDLTGIVGIAGADLPTGATVQVSNEPGYRIARHCT